MGVEAFGRTSKGKGRLGHPSCRYWALASEGSEMGCLPSRSSQSRLGNKAKAKHLIEIWPVMESTYKRRK